MSNRNKSVKDIDRSNWPVLAICYDFDKTLSPRNMQEFGLIKDLGYEDSSSGYKKFWDGVNEFARAHEMDKYLAGMCYTIDKMYSKQMGVRPELLEQFGGDVSLYEGVSTWFDRIRQYGEKHHVLVEHYIISAGFKEMLDGVKISKSRLLKNAVTRIYASSFYFDTNGVRVWPARVIDATTKTRILYRIKKNVMDESDPAVHDPVPKSRVPFRNMVYIGDSETDVPCMEIVREKGGLSIGVYDPKTANKDRILQIMKAGRISYYTPADYSKGSKIEKLVELFIDRVQAEAALDMRQSEMNEEFVNAQRAVEKAKRVNRTAQRRISSKDIRKLLDKEMTFATPIFASNCTSFWRMSSDVYDHNRSNQIFVTYQSKK